MVFFPPVRSLVKDVSGPPVMPSDRLVGAAPDNPDILTPVIVNNAMTLNQGDSVTLTGAILSATDGDTSDPSLSFTVSGVTFGQFERVSNPGASVTVFQQSEITAGAVVFVHDGTANAPAYSVQVSDGTNSSGVAAATITFTPVSYPLDVTAGGPVITGGSQVGTLVVRATSDGDSSDQVMVQFDDGTDDNRINFYREAGNMTLYAKSGGSFEANGAVVGSNPNNTSFVCAVSWEQDNALTSYDGVTGQSDTDFDLPIGLNNILLNDSYFGGTGNFTIAQIDYYPFTHSQAALNALTGEVPTIVNNSLTITQGETVVLDGNDLSATDPDSDDTSLTFTVSSVTNGQFENTASAGVAITSWLQSDVTAGNIQFVHDGSANAPAYDVVVDDGELNSGAVAAASVTFTLATVTPPSLLGSSIHGLQEVEDLTVSYTVAAGGSDTVLIVVTHGTDNANEGREVVDSVTFNGANLSKAVAHINNGVDEVETGIWYLTDPPTITADVVINGSETPNMRAYTVCVLQDASQSGPEATAAATGAHDDSPYELGITTLSDDAIIVSALNMHTNRTFAPNSGQTIVQTSGGTNIGYGTGYKVRASAGTETDSYTATKDENTAHVAAAWGPSGNPSGGGGGNPATPLVDGATPLIDGATPVIG